ncbi:MAG TPA: hypothetical protein VN648_14500 [Candidatus Methylomirabilis sp.]|nr:hypothetical protein [Candidatus Methylomirabilis sp.]
MSDQDAELYRNRIKSRLGHSEASNVLADLDAGSASVPVDTVEVIKGLKGDATPFVDALYDLASNIQLEGNASLQPFIEFALAIYLLGVASTNMFHRTQVAVRATSWAKHASLEDLYQYLRSGPREAPCPRANGARTSHTGRQQVPE